MKPKEFELSPYIKWGPLPYVKGQNGPRMWREYIGCTHTVRVTLGRLRFGISVTIA